MNLALIFFYVFVIGWAAVYFVLYLREKMEKKE